MGLSKNDVKLEETRLEDTINLVRKKISLLGQELYDREDKIEEFKRFMWDNRTDMDPTELKTMMSDSDLEVSMMMKKGEYLQKLYRIQGNPYFGRIIFTDGINKDDVYIGITHVEDDNNNYYVYDWRSPICNLFYDYEVGKASYIAPLGKIEGEITLKRQYTIKDGKLKHIFDNNTNIDDELLQEVLASASSEKMKNIVNTIQAEQNTVIRNTEDKNLIVEGIAGSGKTSVALHRIAFLLYRIDNLKSDNILIFSPNKVFSEYISNVLPELGENNTMQTTINDFLSTEIKEFYDVETFTAFIERSYSGKCDFDFIKYKQSDRVYDDIDKYIDDLCKKIRFNDDLFTRDYSYTKSELDYMLNVRYSKLPLGSRIQTMAEKISENNFNGRTSKSKKISKELYDRLNLPKDLVDIYINFFNSVLVAVCSVLLAAIIASALGYVIARFRFPGRDILFGFIVLTMIIPGLTLIIPQYQLAVKLKAINSLAGLIPFYTAWTIPYSTFMIKGFVENIPKELDEATYMDGGSVLTVFWKIIIPLAKPGIASVSIFNFLTAWEEFPWANTVINDNLKRTMPIAISGFFGQHQFTQWGYVFALSVFSLLPILLVFIFCQKFFVAGLTTGSVKG